MSILHEDGTTRDAKRRDHRHTDPYADSLGIDGGGDPYPLSVTERAIAERIGYAGLRKHRRNRVPRLLRPSFGGGSHQLRWGVLRADGASVGGDSRGTTATSIVVLGSTLSIAGLSVQALADWIVPLVNGLVADVLSVIPT